MDIKLVLSLIGCLCAFGVLVIMIVLYRKGIITSQVIEGVGDLLDALPSDTGSDWLGTLLYYCRLAVRAVEQMVKAGQLAKDDETRKNQAIEYVKEYASAEGRKLTDQELNVTKSLIEAEVYRLRSRVLAEGMTCPSISTEVEIE